MTEYQKQILMKSFQVNVYVNKEEEYQLSTLLNISQKSVEKWFTTMRYVRRRKAKGMLPPCQSEYV